MKLFDVYPLMDLELVKAKGCTVWDAEGQEYLDLYGGHAVISVGHTHPHYTGKLKAQLDNIAFFSNSVQNSLQVELAEKLGALSGYDDFQLFLCNSGAEANENALKLASFVTGKKKVVAFHKGFHGRTSAAVEVTDNAKIQAPINQNGNAVLVPWEDTAAVREALSTGECCAVIVEGVQGIAGIYEARESFLLELRQLCDAYNVPLILDEIQSGYGRTGKFFAHQHTAVRADLITMAKGMGNGFPIGGVLVSPKFEASYGLLGTTFGGNHLACSAAIAVLDILKEEHLLEQAIARGAYLKSELIKIPGVKEVRGTGLMLGIEFDYPIKELRTRLVKTCKVLTGNAANPNVLRLLPPLSLTQEQAAQFIQHLQKLTA